MDSPEKTVQNTPAKSSFATQGKSLFQKRYGISAVPYYNSLIIQKVETIPVTYPDKLINKCNVKQSHFSIKRFEKRPRFTWKSKQALSEIFKKTCLKVRQHIFIECVADKNIKFSPIFIWATFGYSVKEVNENLMYLFKLVQLLALYQELTFLSLGVYRTHLLLLHLELRCY